MNGMDSVHRSFRTALEGGHRAERAWVDEVRQNGRSVAHGRKLVIRHHNKNRDHCETPDAVGMVSIEVKERSIRFTSPEDYPYPTVFVDDMHGLEREELQHIAYVYRSRPTGKWVWLTPLDRDDDWKIEQVFDRGRGHVVPTLVAPKRVLRPAATLMAFLYPHGKLELVDGDAGLFIHGGGTIEERDHHIKGNDQEAGGGDRPPAKEVD